MRGDYMLSAVTEAVSDRFPNLPVLNETSGQTAAEYLFVAELSRDQSPGLCGRYTRKYFYDVRYHPDQLASDQNQQVGEVAEGLMECLAHIDTEDRPVRAVSLRPETKDGILHCFADYTLWVWTQPEAASEMAVLETAEHIK